ncbi:MAG TPA: SEC-C metal-binding domain-containing protein [Parachlamydiaceae bacterium]|nr:SEC-C metal-binding domain-containing protein [Parachlamydiaceae bacterium]
MMQAKVGRNDPCPCGSGKKFKHCCFLTKGGAGTKKKLTAKWINAPQKEAPNLIERTFGQVIEKIGDKPPQAK